MTATATATGSVTAALRRGSCPHVLAHRLSARLHPTRAAAGSPCVEEGEGGMEDGAPERERVPPAWACAGGAWGGRAGRAAERAGRERGRLPHFRPCPRSRATPAPAPARGRPRRAGAAMATPSAARLLRPAPRRAGEARPPVGVRRRWGCGRGKEAAETKAPRTTTMGRPPAAPGRPGGPAQSSPGLGSAPRRRGQGRTSPVPDPSRPRHAQRARGRAGLAAVAAAAAAPPPCAGALWRR